MDRPARHEGHVARAQTAQTGPVGLEIEQARLDKEGLVLITVDMAPRSDTGLNDVLEHGKRPVRLRPAQQDPQGDLSRKIECLALAIDDA